ncbi:MAG: NAD(P)/FAD-dependent oxidoreductase [Pseudomonadota bacterium]
MSKNTYDTIIVGGGVSGLEIGALLAHDGRRVLVLEKSKTACGRARLWKKDGFTVDYGIHLIRFGPESAMSKICRRLGREIRYKPLGPSYVYDGDGHIKLFPTGPAGFLRSEMFGLFERLKALATMIKIKLGRFNGLQEVSVRDWMRQNGIDGSLARYFTMVSASMMVCPFIERSSAGEMLANISKVLSTGYSVMYPAGGWGPLFDLFEKTIRAGGEIRLGAKVDRVIMENGKAVGVSCGGREIRGRSVILCVPVQEIFDGLLDEKNFPDEVVAACRSLRPTAGVVLDYGLRTKICDDSGLWYLWKPLSFGMFTSNLEPGLAPEGKQLLTWLYPTGVEDMKDPETAKKREHEIEEALFNTFPGLERNVEWRRAMRLRMVDGVEVNVRQYREKRVGPCLTGAQNLYLAGDATAADGAGGDVAQQSVLECYRAVTGRSL